MLKDIEAEILSKQYLAAMNAVASREGQLMLLNSAIKAEMPWAADKSAVAMSKEQSMVELYKRLKPESK
jgi:hypothetical protein